MQKLKTVTLAEGDSVLIVRNLKTEESYEQVVTQIKDSMHDGNV